MPGDEISFEVVAGPNQVGDRADPQQAAMQNSVARSLDRQAAMDAEKERRGIPTKEQKTQAAEIPPDVPKALFRIGAKIVECDKFKLDDEDARTFAKHLTILTGGVNSKIFSAIVILLIIFSKIAECFDAIKRKFFPPKTGETAAPQAPEKGGEVKQKEHLTKEEIEAKYGPLME